MNVSMKKWWNDTEKSETVGNKPVPVPFCPPKISHKLIWDKNKEKLIFTLDFMKLSTGTFLLSVIQRLMMLHYFL
jgi:hypothetical protein